MNNPVTEMYGNGSQPVEAGTFSSNTSMTIATIDSIIKERRIEYNSLMKNYTEWIINGKFTVTNEAIDIDKTTIKALTNYNQAINESNEVDPRKCGIDDSVSNESLQRMIPIVFYIHFKKLNQEQSYKLIKDITNLTNMNEINLIANFIYVNYLLNILHGKDKYASLNMIKSLNFSIFDDDNLSKFDRILNKDISKLKVDEINSTSDIISTLEAVLWIVLNTDNYSQSLIGAVSLGNDTDTICALTGAITSLLYGYDNIPSKWKDKLIKKEYLIEYSKEFERILDME